MLSNSLTAYAFMLIINPSEQETNHEKEVVKMQITVEEFKTYFRNVRTNEQGLQNCCSAFVFDNSYHFDNGYDVFISVSVCDGDSILSFVEFRKFFDNSLDAYAFAISHANFNYL